MLLFTDRQNDMYVLMNVHNCVSFIHNMFPLWLSSITSIKHHRRRTFSALPQKLIQNWPDTSVVFLICFMLNPAVKDIFRVADSILATASVAQVLRRRTFCQRS